MIMMTMMLMMLMQMTLSFDERAARSDFTESTCICPWGQRASGTHAIGRVAREGLRSPPGAPGQTEQYNLGKSVTECIWVRCVLGADDLCEKAGSAHVTCYPRAGVSHVTLGRARHMSLQGARVTCYPGAPVSHVTLGRPCHMLSSPARVSHVTLGRRVTCYPRAPVSRVTLGRPCHMLSPGRACHMLS